LLLKLNVSFSVIGTPEAVFARGESDHAPTALSFGKSSRCAASDPPIPAWITKHPSFKYHVSSLVESVEFFSLKSSEQLNTYNSCIKEAARRVRNEALYTNPDGTEEKNWYCLRFRGLCGSIIWDLQGNLLIILPLPRTLFLLRTRK
jgi:hypothetical protein